MPNPRHVNPPGNAATAAYNFVPLPERVLKVAGEGDDPVPPRCRSHDRWLDGHHRGWIELTIETHTPLFIRGPVTQSRTGWDQREARRRPEPWLAADRPVIPGSSLRGMVRTLVEILAFAKVTPVSRDRPFFRTFLPDDRIGNAYRDRMVRGKVKPQGGFLSYQSGQWWVKPAGGVLRVDRDVLGTGLRLTFDAGADKVPPSAGQHQPCWVVDDGTRVSAISWKPSGGRRAGTLVLTGNAPAEKNAPVRKSEFVFLPPEADDPVRVPDEIWDRFHDDDQITRWQKNAFPPRGRLEHGTPVFYVTRPDDSSTVEFLGRAQMFRLPYDLAVCDLVPDAVRDGGIDMAEAIFGRVAGHVDDRRTTIKGRVFFEDCVASSARHGFLEDEVIVPRILSSPKPTTFSHYLTQDGRRPAGERTTYLRGDADKTVVRGHKLYWHRWGEEGLAVVRALNIRPPLPPNDTQHTVMRPVTDGVTFCGRIRFDNLDDGELGALLAALDLPEHCAHKLGMARPLGLGSVRVTPTLHLIDSATRYASWAGTGELCPDKAAKTEQRCRSAFESAVLRHAHDSGEAMVRGGVGLAQVARLDVLFTMLSWDGRPPSAATADLAEAGGPTAFKNRRVLPTPHTVAGLTDPWPPPAPAPAPAGQPGVPEHGRRGAPPAGRRRPGPEPPVTPTRRVLKGVMLAEQTAKGKPLVQLDDRIGYVDGPLPPGIAPGDDLDLVWLADHQPYCRLAWADPANPPPPPKPPSRKARPKPGRGGR